jgi:hypothetical protein
MHEFLYPVQFFNVTLLVILSGMLALVATNYPKLKEW